MSVADRVGNRAGQSGGFGAPQPGAQADPGSALPTSIMDFFAQYGIDPNAVYSPDQLNAIAVALQMGGVVNQFQQYDLQTQQNQLSQAQIEQAGRELGLSADELQQRIVEFQFQREQAPLSHEVDMMNLRNQLTLGDYDLQKAHEYSLSNQYNTEQARLGAEQARYNYMATTGMLEPYTPPGQRQSPAQYGRTY